MIAPDIDSLKIGAVEKLAAVIVAPDNTRRSVAAAWESDAPEIVAISDDGQLQATSLGATTIRVRFEQLTAANAVRVVPDVEGIWTGRYRVVSCSRLSGRGPDLCRYELTGNGAIYPLRVILAQRGGKIDGTLDLYNSAGGVLQVGTVEGLVASSGSIDLSGTVRSVYAEGNLRTVVSEWHAGLTGDGSGMTGGFIRTSTFENFWGPQQITMECMLLDLHRSTVVITYAVGEMHRERVETGASVSTTVAN